jgi:hypothetical protein
MIMEEFVALKGGFKKLRKMMFRKPENKSAFAIFRVRLKDNIKIHLQFGLKLVAPRRDLVMGCCECDDKLSGVYLTGDLFNSIISIN